MPRGIGESVALPGIEQELRGLRAQGPQRTRPLDPRAGIGALKTARRIERDGRIKSADLDADLRIGCGGQPFLLGNVGPALEQLRRHAHGNLGQRQVKGR